ncbi:MAG: hypothetical protein Q9227_006595 [Pyrenula ochraceoflavens]
MAGIEDDTPVGDAFEGIPLPSREGAFSPSRGPLLSEILANSAPPPYTLTAFMAFLAQNHCLETLEFTMDAKRYHEKFDLVAASMAGMPITSDSHEGADLQRDWKRMLDMYVVPGAPREINLPSEDRDELLEFPHAVKAPPPEALQQAMSRMYDLMQESIYLPFINSFSSPNLASESLLQPPEPEFSLSGDPSDLAPPRTSYEDSRLGRHMSRRRQRSPQSSSMDITSSRHLSAFRSTGSQRHSTHLTQQPTLTSAATSTTDSTAIYTDDSGSASSPSASGGMDRDLMTPPTTPPSSELGGVGSRESTRTSPHSKSGRTESGGWKRMSQKLSKSWTKKRSAGHLREPKEGNTSAGQSESGGGKGRLG